MSDFSRKRAEAAKQSPEGKPGRRKTLPRRPGSARTPGNDNPGGNTGAIELIGLRTEFYKDRAQTLTWAALALFLAIAVCGVSIFTLATRQPDTLYIPTREDGTLAKRVPVNQAYLTQTELAQWVSRAVRKSFTFNYVYYKEELAAAEQYFTPRGHERFVEALNARLLPTVLQNSLIMETATKGAPIIDNDGVVRGIYTWDLTVPATRRVYGVGISNAPTSLILCLTVQREDTLINRDGVAITNVIVLPPRRESCARAQ